MRLFFPKVVFMMLLFFSLKAEAQLYQIRLATTPKAPPADYFDQLKPLGVLYTEQGDDALYKISLGNYWGRAAADAILEKVIAAGFSSAYLTQKQLDPNKTYALQFLALSELHVNYLPESIHEHLIISKHEEVYRLSLGLVAASGKEFEHMKALLQEIDRERYWLRRLWRSTPQNTPQNKLPNIPDHKDIQKEEPKGEFPSGKLPEVRKNPKAKLRPSKMPDESEH